MLEPLRAFKRGRAHLSGRDVAGAERRVPLIEPDARAEVAAPGLERRFVDDGAGGDDADDVALDEPLRLRGVLRLLADGDLVALGDQAGDVGVGGVVWDAAHGHLLLEGLRLVLVAGGQHQIQLARSGLCVVAEHLVEIPQAEKEDRLLILFLDFQILAHHGGQFSHIIRSLSVRYGRLYSNPVDNSVEKCKTHVESSPKSAHVLLSVTVTF